MKKNYLKPEIMAVKIKSEHLLLTVSTLLPKEGEPDYMLDDDEYFD